ncbi:MAG: hypothetical protein P8016_13345 [Sedimentisphaerales bacterium]|jgi:hypothetical protein
MKNSKEYSKKITSLYQSLKRKHPKVSPSGYLASHKDVVDTIVYGVICEKLSEKGSEAAMKRFSEYFVDWNDLRVSRIEEIAEQLGDDTPENRQIALTITRVLQKIFNENHQINLESLQKMGKRQARQKLEKTEDLSRFVVDYCMLICLGSHAIPLTEKMIEYLKANDLVDKEADPDAIEGFLSKQIAAKNGYEFYELLRNESETHHAKLSVSVSNAGTASARSSQSEAESQRSTSRKTSKKKTTTTRKKRPVAAKTSTVRKTTKQKKTKKKVTRKKPKK